MPELPDVLLYCDALRRFVVGHPVRQVVVRSPFVIRSIDPPLEAIEGSCPASVSHLGKRLCLGFENGVYLVIHLMIAGRLHWKKPATRPSAKRDLVAFHFDHGTLMLTEAGHKHRASIHVEPSREAALAHDPGGVDVMTCSFEDFEQEISAENRTLKRALTNPRRFCGIGNAYSDEILWHAKLSPIKLTNRLTPEEKQRLWLETRKTMELWIARLLKQTGDSFPTKVTAFRPEMEVHGKCGTCCSRCQHPIQQIVYADNETNYCAACQNDGVVLADRSLSRLLKRDWPRRIEDWELDQ